MSRRGSAWTFNLSPEQVERCKQVMEEARSYRNHKGATAYQDTFPNIVMEGWTVLVSPSVGPAKLVRCRYRDRFGKLLVDEDCS